MRKLRHLPHHISPPRAHRRNKLPACPQRKSAKKGQARLLVPTIAAAIVLTTSLTSADIVIVDEFNSIASVSASGGASATQSKENAHFGRYGLTIDYEFATDQNGNVRSTPLLTFRESIGRTGTLSLWVRGDASKNSVRLELARSFQDTRGRKLYLSGKNNSGNWVTWVSGSMSLASGTWKELTLRVPRLSADDRERKVEIEARLLLAPHLEEQKAVQTTGQIAIDSMRVNDPVASGEKAFVSAGLIGRAPFRADQPIELYTNVINYSEVPAVVRVQTLVVDRNDVQVGGSETTFGLPGLAEMEKFIGLEFQVAAATPPLTVEFGVRSAELQLQTSQELEVAIVNSEQVLDSFDQVHTRWWTKAGYMPGGNGQNHLSHSRPSRQIRIERVTAGAQTPPSCLSVRYDVSQKGSYAIATDQYLPGGPTALGVWVKGDGSPHQLWAALEERHPITGFTWRWMWGTPPWDKNNHNYGGPNRYVHNVLLGDLSNKEWTFLQATMPGAGIGNYDLKLRGPLIDYPFEFKGFFISPVRGGPETGQILLDEITVDTQLSPAEALSVFVFADDQAQDFAKTKTLHARFGNPSLLGETGFNCVWTISDAADEPLFSQRKKLELARGKSVVETLDLQPLREKLTPARGPLQVTATIVDAADAARRASHTIWLKKPDSSVLCFDFESDRRYVAAGESGPTDGHSPAQAHHGKFAMLLKSVPPGPDGKGGQSEGVRLSPALPGTTTSVSLWVFGDGSDITLQPYITDSVENGRHSMWASEQFALSRIEVKWKGWRQVVLDLPNLGEHSLDSVNRVAEITYPIDLSIVTEGSGQVWIDEIRAYTHLPPEERIVAELDFADETYLFAPGAIPHVSIQNTDLAARVQAEATINLTSADGRAVQTQRQNLTLAPLSQHSLPLCAKGLPLGVYIADLTIARGDAEPVQVHECVQVCDIKSILGPGYQDLLRDAVKLRLNLLENRQADLLDWDNAEPLPGRHHFNWFDARLAEMKAKGFEPMIRLGYAADWAGSQGYEQLTKGTYQRAFPNSMHVPTDVKDWSEYVRACMRRYRGQTERWLVWENPNSGPPLNVPPAKMVEMLAAARRWNRLYCPKAKLYLGGLLQQNGLDYLATFQQTASSDSYYGVEWKADMGGLPPERGGLDETIDDLRAIMGPERSEPDRVIVTGLDWATGKGRADEFQQAAWIVRAHLILRAKGVGLPVVTISNDAHERDGGGLVYRPQTGLASSPEQLPFFRVKPSYLAAWHIRRAMADWTFLTAVELLDALPHQTRCLLFQAKGELVAALWRAEGDAVALAIPGPVRPVAAVNGFGHPINVGELRVSAMPILLTFRGVSADVLASALGLAALDLPENNWSPVEHLSPTSPADRARLRYLVNPEAKPIKESGILPGAGKLTVSGLEGLKKETFVVTGRPEGEFFIRKRYLLTGEGQVMAVVINGKEAGRWDLQHSRTVPTIGGGARKLPGGLRDACFLVPAELLSDKEQKIELVYEPAENPSDNNCFGLWLLSTPSRKLRLTQLGPIYSVIGRGRIQFDRNIAAGPLAVGDQQFVSGLGTHSPALIEYTLSGQFKRFTATVGIDRMTEGRGSVVFEVHADDKPILKTGVMSGFSKPEKIDIDVTGTSRLTLIVKDADDGPKNDYANWCDAELEY